MGSQLETMKILSLLLILPLASGEGPCSSIITKWTVWEGGLASTLHVPVTNTIHHWNVSLSFNKEFTNINFYNGLSDLTAGSSFYVYNEDWSGDKEPGDIIGFSL